ncbi:MFS transporter [Gemmobacter lutimaris]|uniref:MFS transporter n=1 Tax=Gemmobacter lutimaris TaxID=2306023 RepID=A0A398BW82_9RHOB|nr:MFS transporter [Gemmobacter lutimaris]RID93181.1 MFS transporter [Gemmobacter lutimaris]
MANKYIPLFLRHSPTPRIQNFALLAGLEAAVRGTLISVMPLVMYEALQDAAAVSRAYFVVGLISMIWGLMVPWATRFVPRRWVYTAGALAYLLAMSLALTGGPVAVPLALLAMALATATCFVCFNAYVLDYVARADLGRTQSLQMVYAAAPWALGPLFGVWLREAWRPLPFLIAGGFAIALLVTFWVLRLGNGKQIQRARGPAINPLAYLGRFSRQPRLIAGWLFAVLRSCGWWVYVVYLPIFCIEVGLGDKVGGVALSLSNGLLFLTPLMLRFVQRHSVRRTVRGAFALCMITFSAAGLLAGWPWVTVGCLLAGSIGLVTLDAAGGLPFMLSVKPSERVEMAAVYSSFRDVSGVVTPGVAWAVLLVAPLSGVFLASGLGFVVAFAIAGRLHPRLGAARPSRGGV